MARWAPVRADTLTALAAEILHNYGRGRAVVAIDGGDPAVLTAFADDLATALRDAGRVVDRASTRDVATAAPVDTLLLADGPLSAVPAGAANLTIWLERRGDGANPARGAASVLVDVTDPDHPRRVFADSC